MACLGSRMTISWRYQYGWKIRILPEVLPKLLMVMQKKEKRRKRAKLFWLKLKLLLSVVCDSRLRKYSCLKIWLKVSLSPLTPIPIPDFRTPTGLVLALISQPSIVTLHCYHAEQKGCCYKQGKKNQSFNKKVIVEQDFSVRYNGKYGKCIREGFIFKALT